MTGNLSLVIAFTAGLLSFLSPCVLPLAPVYLASLCGAGIYDAGSRTRVPLFFHSLSFIAGFSLLFVSLGAVAGLTGFAINPGAATLNKISGSLLIAFGLFMLAALKVPWLSFEKRLTPALSSSTGYARSFLIGAVFSMGWTACVGPILGGILALAMNSATALKGAYLLAVYSLGLGLPFLIIGVAFDYVRPVLKHVRRYSGWVSGASGLLLIAVGSLIVTDNLSWFSSLIA